MGHAGTEQKYYDQVVEFAKAIGMVPLCLKKEQPGYILNSMLVPFLSSAQMLAATGVADIETIDPNFRHRRTDNGIQHYCNGSRSKRPRISKRQNCHNAKVLYR